MASSTPANHLQDGGACVEVSTRCSPPLLGWLVCADPLRVWSPATAFHGVWDSAGPTRPDCYWSVQLRRQWTTNMEQSASQSSNTRYDTALFQASSQGTPVSAVVYAAADWWLSTVRPAPLWLCSEFGAVYKYSDLLIERGHFRWPWTTPSPVCKVTLFFAVEYLING